MKIHFEYNNAEHATPPTVLGTPYDEVRMVEGDEVFRLSTVYTQPSSLVQIVISEIHNAKQTNSSLTRVTTEEGEIVIAKGTIDIPDKSLILTFARNDETKKQYKFGVDLVDGQFEVALSFKETGQYIFTDEQANLGLVEPMFTVDAVTVDVLTKTT